MEPKGTLLYSEELASGPYPEPAASSPHIHTIIDSF
jgi:hypothetical protein